MFKRYNINDNKFEDYFSSIPYVELHKYTTLYSIDWNNWNGDWGDNTFINTYCLKNDLIKYQKINYVLQQLPIKMKLYM